MFVIIPSTFQPGILKTFELCVYSDKEVALKQLTGQSKAQPLETEENDGLHTKEKKMKKKRQEDSEKQSQPTD